MVIVPMRDFAEDFGIVGDETRFEECPREEAEIWSIIDTEKDELIEDYSTEQEAKEALLELMKGGVK